jgi:hypothetical protein
LGSKIHTMRLISIDDFNHLSEPFPVSAGYFYKVVGEKDNLVLKRISTNTKKEETLLEMSEAYTAFDISPDNASMVATLKNKPLLFATCNFSEPLETTLYDGIEPIYGGDGKIYSKRGGNQVWVTDSVDASSKLLFSAEDDIISMEHSVTRSRRFLVICCNYATCNQSYLLDLHDETAEMKVFAPRTDKVHYRIFQQESTWFIITNRDGASNNKLMKASTSNTEEWEDVFDYNEHIEFLSVECFKEFAAFLVKINGLHYFWLYKQNGEVMPIQSFEVSWAVEPCVNREYQCRYFRYVYQSPLTPSTLMEADSQTMNSTVVAVKPTPDDYKPDVYRLSRMRVPGIGSDVTIVSSIKMHGKGRKIHIGKTDANELRTEQRCIFDPNIFQHIGEDQAYLVAEQSLFQEDDMNKCIEHIKNITF